MSDASSELYGGIYSDETEKAIDQEFFDVDDVDPVAVDLAFRIQSEAEISDLLGQIIVAKAKNSDLLAQTVVSEAENIALRSRHAELSAELEALLAWEEFLLSTGLTIEPEMVEEQKDEEDAD